MSAVVTMPAPCLPDTAVTRLSEDLEQYFGRTAWRASVRAARTAGLGKGVLRPHLVHCGTGSGKTQAYLFLSWRLPRFGSPVDGDPSLVCRWLSPGEYVRAFVEGLIGLWRKVDTARFARMVALRLNDGRAWAVFHPDRPPGQLLMASGHATRGPDATRMPQVIRGESFASE